MDIKERASWIIGDVIKKHGLSNDKLAQKIGCNKGTVNNYRRKNNTPNGDFIETFCKKFNVSPMWFITGKGEPYETNSIKPSTEDHPLRQKLLTVVAKRKNARKTLEERAGWVIADIIERNGLSAQSLAESTGHNAETINDYIQLKSKPSERFMFDMCRTHNVCPVWLFTGIGEPYIREGVKLTDNDYWEAKSDELEAVHNEEVLVGPMTKKHIPDDKANKAKNDLSETVVDDGEYFLDIELTDAQRKTLIQMGYDFITYFEKEMRRKIGVFIYEFITDKKVSQTKNKSS